MWHFKLRQVLTLSYYHLLIFGLMATTLRFGCGTSRITIYKQVPLGYILYSLVLTALFLAGMLLMVPRNLFDGYMKYNIVLQWSYFIVLALRLAVILGFYSLIWLQRESLKQLYLDFYAHWQKSARVLKRIAGRKVVQELQQSQAQLLVLNLIANYGTIVCSTTVQAQLLGAVNWASLVMFLIRLTHLALLMVLKIGFYSVLLLLNHQFEAVHLALEALQRKQKNLQARELRSLAVMHGESFALARRLFVIYDVANATLFINLFAASVNILYHAVQYSNKTIKSNIWGMIFGDGLIMFNMWNSSMLMNMLDCVLNSCNSIGQSIRQYSELKVSPKIQMELDLLANSVKNKRLIYKICGCVVLNKPAFLSYFGAVLGHVIILMQFDLKRQSMNSVTQNFLPHLQKDN